MDSKIHNIKLLKKNRKSLRNNLTPAEATLWNLLKKSKLSAKKFRRQHSIGFYIVDFYCPSERLAIELDGDYHFTEAGFEYDTVRTTYLNSLNIRVLRFENRDIFEHTEFVVEEIRKFFNHPSHEITTKIITD